MARAWEEEEVSGGRVYKLFGHFPFILPYLNNPNILGSHNQNPKTSKVNVPELKEFTGTDKESYGWIEETLNTMGRVGLSMFLTSKAKCEAKPELAERIFHALCKATLNGLARHVSQNMLNMNNHCPYELWKGLQNYYKTYIHKANVIFCSILKSFLLLS